MAPVLSEAEAERDPRKIPNPTNALAFVVTVQRGRKRRVSFFHLSSPSRSSYRKFGVRSVVRLKEKEKEGEKERTSSTTLSTIVNKTKGKGRGRQFQRLRGKEIESEIPDLLSARFEIGRKDSSARMGVERFFPRSSFVVQRAWLESIWSGKGGEASLKAFIAGLSEVTSGSACRAFYSLEDGKKRESSRFHGPPKRRC